ncbi:DEAD/DEAH box helicase [Aquimarina brevivitae]|uniref:ATP-dependent RNA helicase DeaD n=1 Tax=Aquimarina brevivitae TaxID=323412 RepID=A0A4Q7NU56_9FLAO|nr:DEAD/DEAH box helicase [Aquimarina brevivitae]RZS90460.1 ATP-dependent RNA helicase DeaD [Aquimarina brevivitae]
MSFLDLGVSTDVVKGLKELGIVSPTKIQEQAIPVLLNNDLDFIGQAQTGTGKTAAFGVPLLSKVDPKNTKVQALVLAPTRELGQQIAKQLFKFTKYTDKIFTEAVYGGEKIDIQIKRLQRPTHIIVATPGRLVDLMAKKVIDLAKVETVVLDEADEMLSMGFKADLEKILATTGRSKNVWLFSATMPATLDDIVKKYLKPDAIRITVDQQDAVNKSIEHQYVVLDSSAKLDTLTYFLKTKKQQRGIVFTRTKAAARELYQQLWSMNYKVGLLEGEMTQKDRDKTLRGFKNKSLQLLVSTDVAARGIDVANLGFVVHYELPDQTDYYTHRSGRTGRAGNKGLSVAFVTRKEVAVLKNLERELHIRFSQIR